MATLKFKINSNDSLLEAFSEAKDFWEEHKYCNLTISDKRSLDQNALQFFWYEQLEKQGDYSRDEYRSLCKYKFGVPILSQEPEFQYVIQALKSIDWEAMAAKWQLSIEWAKAAFVGKMEITSKMSPEQMQRYLDAIKNYFEPKGFALPNKLDR